jgi:hypothetical protein
MNDKLIILHHTEMGDCINMNGLVRYMRKIYKKIIIFCQPKYVSNVQTLYHNTQIEVLSLDNEITKYKFTDLKSFYYNDIPNIYNNIVKYASENNHDIMCCGDWKKKRESYKQIPYEFYDDANVPRNIYWNYSYIPITEEAQNLYNFIKNKEYIFIHVKEYNKNIKKLIKNMKRRFLVLNPSDELYDVGTPENIIEKYIIKKPIFYYTLLIENAKKIIVIDSSFFCLSLHLNIKSPCCYYIKTYSSSIDYEKYLWDKNNGYNGTRRKFRLLYL